MITWQEPGEDNGMDHVLIKSPADVILFSGRALAVTLAAGGFDKIVPCRGFVRFSKSLFRLLLQSVLQVFRIDGQLRFIAVKNGEKSQSLSRS